MRRLLPALLTLALAVAFAGLGWWQIERRAWKIDLIDRVETRVTAPPVAPPGPGDWADLTREDAEYLRVSSGGRFRGETSLVQAVTELGAGYWVLQPFVTDDGPTILVNRGFVPSRDAEITRPEGPVEVTGLLRMTEPDGGFLRANDPKAGRWYSRDVDAIARAMDLGQVAPYFIDAEAGANGGAPPEGGLTVIAFRNTHMVYALTWFTLMAMSLGATWLVLRVRPKGRPTGADG
ncbi:SURF1 family protein [Palleronia sp. LCG004]|uniref:SURF1 family protein n=1 Tax=Palleronia sp. LCG004 TaxID=3079304 RepID=UPI00294281F5|nr:SURF1 family protein [Palleronia sp. LCG004]WOI57993.1 SURF1 family protein [Palleronia sp. LCG004]